MYKYVYMHSQSKKLHFRLVISGGNTSTRGSDPVSWIHSIFKQSAAESFAAALASFAAS